MNDQREGIPLDYRVLYFAFYIYQDILRQEEKTMSMTPEEINRIYIQEHGMTKDVGEKSTVCIAYESGRWWHYKKADNGFAWW